MAADQGTLEARTLPGAGAPVDRGGDQGAADPQLGGDDPADLLLGLPDLDGDDVLALTADLANASRRARGRPAGSGNRKNADMIAYLQSRGHRDPWVTLSLIQSADTRALAIMLGEVELHDDGTPKRDLDGKPVIRPAPMMATIQLQRAAAEAILPYHHGKKPQQLELLDDRNKRPFMVIGEANIAVISHGGFATAGEMVPSEQNQGVIEGDAVRERPAPGDGAPSA